MENGELTGGSGVPADMRVSLVCPMGEIEPEGGFRGLGERLARLSAEGMEPVGWRRVEGEKEELSHEGTKGHGGGRGKRGRRW